MQKFEFLRQPLLGELAMSRKKERRKKERKNAIYSGHLRFCLQPRAAHALRSDQDSVRTLGLLYIAMPGQHHLVEVLCFQFNFRCLGKAPIILVCYSLGFSD